MVMYPSARLSHHHAMSQRNTRATTLVFEDAIATVSLHNGPGNRISFSMREELSEALREVAASAVRVLVIRAVGDDFCLGGDVREWPGVPLQQLRPKIAVFANALEQLEQLQIPTIAGVQGRCWGGGLELVLSCDLVIATQSAQFACPEALLGIVTLQGGVYQLAQRVGRTRALEMAFLSESVGADEMARLNLISRVVPIDSLSQEIDLLSTRLASGPRRAYAVTKSLLRTWSAGGISSAKEALYEVSMPLFEDEEVQSALRAAAVAADEGRPFQRAHFS